MKWLTGLILPLNKPFRWGKGSTSTRFALQYARFLKLQAFHARARSVCRLPEQIRCSLQH